MREILMEIGDVVLLTSFPALALFVIFYLTKSPWRKTLVGRSLMYFAMSLLMIVITVTLTLFFGREYFLREWIRLCSYILVSVMSWRLFITLRYIQKRYSPNEVETITEDVENNS